MHTIRPSPAPHSLLPPPHSPPLHPSSAIETLLILQLGVARAGVLLERRLVRGALPVLLAVLADERLGRGVALQLRLAARARGVLGVALALRGRFGAVAHFWGGWWFVWVVGGG